MKITPYKGHVMCADFNPDFVRAVNTSFDFSRVEQGKAGEAGAGLVPYTTTHTSTSQVLLTMPRVGALGARLSRLKHHVRTASRLVKETMARNGGKWRACFVTLTYRPGVEWSPTHLTSFFNAVRMWGSRQGVRIGYVWVAEMQRRGAIHYHAVVWMPSALRMPRPDKKGWWRHGSTNLQSVKRNAIGYLMKYVSKGVTGDDPDLPKGARVCGSGGLDDMAKDEFHYWRLPRYVRENVVIGERCRRVQGGGWASKVSGECWKSEYGLWGFALVSRKPDCNGRPRAPERVVMLSDVYKRVPGLRQVNHALVDEWRSVEFENEYYRIRGANWWEIFQHVE